MKKNPTAESRQSGKLQKPPVKMQSGTEIFFKIIQRDHAAGIGSVQFFD